MLSVDHNRVLVIGAGPSGATVARVLAEAGFAVTVIERQGHPGGHCHTYRDPKTGIMIHAHGPHVFHSDDPEVWSFIQRFARLRPYAHAARAVTGGRTYPLPITLTTIRQFFSCHFGSTEARAYIAGLARRYDHPPLNFEQRGRSLLGDALYEAFFDGYTRKQWGIDPALLPASVMNRIPVRFIEDQNYFHHKQVAIPESGYTAMVCAMLDHPYIAVIYGAVAGPTEANLFRHTIYTGSIDQWFSYRFGRLANRTLDFEVKRASGTFQEVAQVNYCDITVPWTRIIEYKHFAPWEHHKDTVYVAETSRDCGPEDVPYYPLRLAGDEPLLQAYLNAARTITGVSFVGRLATHRYIDMDTAIAEALAAGRRLATEFKSGGTPPAFLLEMN